MEERFRMLVKNYPIETEEETMTFYGYLGTVIGIERRENGILLVEFTEKKALVNAIASFLPGGRISSNIVAEKYDSPPPQKEDDMSSSRSTSSLSSYVPSSSSSSKDDEEEDESGPSTSKRLKFE
ncbi:uncharacterized protein LOC116348101 [Contarinia nasturtii]|uniref:uncharacterized protein LOC116348101 n=1 Tax=Contarinia nasturtii TaxID=265458 RepID=UPI0012D3ABA8|nr:uncharacterized protein LOC116348101 [Contarinia nasturtii]